MLALLLVACFPRLDPSSGGGDSPDPDSGGGPLVETRCGDDADDDGDGDVDCDDADCVDAPACEPGDTDTDTESPSEETRCADGEDDDGDGDVDCDDADCADAAACEEPDACWDDDVEDTLGAEIASGTASGNDGSASCGGGSSADTLIHWEAPATDTFVFDTVGSDADTTLWIASETCDGEELACDTDTFGTASQVSVSLSRGDEVVIGVEASGAWVLSAWQGDCPAYSIGSELGVQGSTTEQEADYDSTCGEVGNSVTLRWVVPESGTWSFSTEGSTYDTILALYEDDCEGDEITCNDDADDTVGPSWIEQDLTAGQVVAIVVGGYQGAQGSYLLDIAKL